MYLLLVLLILLVSLFMCVQDNSKSNAWICSKLSGSIYDVIDFSQGHILDF